MYHQVQLAKEATQAMPSKRRRLMAVAGCAAAVCCILLFYMWRDWAMATTTTALPKRADMPAEHTWRLEDLYATQDAWNKEYEEVKQLTVKAADFQGKLTDAATLKSCF